MTTNIEFLGYNIEKTPDKSPADGTLIYLSVCLSVGLSVCLSVYLSIEYPKRYCANPEQAFKYAA